MTSYPISLLQDEALRLTAVCGELMTEVLDAPGVLPPEATAPVGSLTRGQASDWITKLKEEYSKVMDLELVVAVVGTMKAGKSTVINAIVGLELLPKRDGAMTALPTLIRHRPEQTEPVLRLAKLTEIQALWSRLNAARLDVGNKAIMAALNADPTMHGALEALRTPLPPAEVHGTGAIYQWLETLNDLVRLSRKFGLPFAFDEFRGRNDFPVIEVEFPHLRGRADRGGHLALLDTPGHNEAGSRLRYIVEQQIDQASAVLAVLDSGQFDTEADAEMRGWLVQASTRAQGRVFVLANRIDELEGLPGAAESLKARVANVLMSGSLREDRIFLTSAKQAFLARRMQRAIAHAEVGSASAVYPGGLPKAGWEEEFCKFARIRQKDWVKIREDLGDLAERADDLWEESRFETPLDCVVTSALAYAAPMAVAAAADQLVACTERLHTLLSIRASALEKSVVALQTAVEELLGDTRRVDSARQRADALAKNALGQFASELKLRLAATQDLTQASVQGYFKEGKRKEELTAASPDGGKIGPAPDKDKSPLWAWGSLFQTIQADVRDFDPDRTEIKLDADEARDFIGKVQASLRHIVLQDMHALEMALGQLLLAFEIEFSRSVAQEVSGVIQDLQQRFARDGVHIRLSLPTPASLSLNLSGVELLLGSVEFKSERYSYRHEKDYPLAGFMRLIGEPFDWGYDTGSYDKEKGVIRLANLKSAAESVINISFAGLNAELNDKLKQPLADSLNLYFNELAAQLDGLRGDLEQALRDKQGSQAEQEELRLLLADLRKRARYQGEESNALKKDMAEVLVKARSTQFQK